MVNVRGLRSAPPWIITGLVVVLEALLLVFVPVEQSDGSSPVLIAMAGAIPLVSAFTALIIAIRRPGNRVAWVLFAISFGVLLLLANPWKVLSPKPVDPTYFDFLTVSYSRVALKVGLFIPIFTLPYLFPTGRFLTRRSAWIGRYVVATTLIVLVLVVFSEEAWVGYIPASQAEWIIQSPVGFIPSPVFDTAVSLLLDYGGLLLAVGGILAMIWRFRRANLTERTQIKWLLYALTLAVLGPLVVMTDLVPSNTNVVGFSLLSGAFLVPIAITVAIVQYRLFDIDRIISQTVAYVLVVVMLGLVFAVGVVWLPSALGLASDSPLLVAGTTLLVAALFNPLRKRVQKAVDKRFNRNRYQARLVEEALALDIQQTRTHEELANIWLQTVNDALSPEASSVWLRPTDHA